MKKYFIDRFEGKYAVCEDTNANKIEILKKDIPDEVKEGDIIINKDGIYYIDNDATEQRREKIIEKQKRIFGK